MRRLVTAVLALLLLGLAALVAPLASAFIGIRKLVPLDLGHGATLVVDGYVGVGLLPLDDGKWMLVDCGNDASGAAILAALAERGATADAVATIFLTHGHPDHVAACPLFERATVYGMAAEQPFLDGEAAYGGPLPRLTGAMDSGVDVKQPVRDGETVHIGGRDVTTFAVPGHTAGSAVYLTDGLLFLGDSATIEDDGGLRPAPWVFTDATSQNREALETLAGKLQGRDVRAVLPAHSGSADSVAPLMAFRAR